MAAGEDLCRRRARIVSPWCHGYEILHVHGARRCGGMGKRCDDDSGFGPSFSGLHRAGGSPCAPCRDGCVGSRAGVVDGDSLVASGQRRRARRQAVVCGGRHTLAVRRFGDPRQRIGTPRPTPGFSATRPAAGSFAAATSSLDISHGVVEVCDDLPRERLHEREGALRVAALNDHYRDNVLMR